MKQAILYKKMKNNLVQCEVCAHQCVIAPQKRGICSVRENQGGKLYSLNYEKAIALNIDPVEKKPLFHFLPGTEVLSLGAAGCNFKCLHCQNYDISQSPKENKKIEGEKISSQQIIDLAQENHLPSIAYTYTEPSIFLEYALEIMKKARAKGLKNIWVSNGYFTEKTFKKIAPYLDAINIDLKFFNDNLYGQICGGKLKPVLENLKRITKSNIWLEITTLLIPGYTDQDNQLEKIAGFIKKELSPDVPWHISRFYPCYKMSNVSPTPPSLINQAIKIGKKAGLKYVYAGNLPSNQEENTYCPVCQTLIIKRTGYSIKRFDKKGFCPQCGEKIDLILK
jgi:pyruvate formate lyase activating enzyme